ncbi:MAG: hypothetical protein Q7S34_03490 [bacterium]|nr:hypothetical protein [bacterium]
MSEYPYNDGPPESWRGTVNDYVPPSIKKDDVIGNRDGKHLIEIDQVNNEVVVKQRQYILHRQHGTTRGFDMSRGYWVDSTFVREAPEWLDSKVDFKAKIVYSTTYNKFRVMVIQKPDDVELEKFLSALRSANNPMMDAMGNRDRENDPFWKYYCMVPWVCLPEKDLCKALEEMSDPQYAIVDARSTVLVWEARHDDPVGGFVFVQKV